MWLKCKTFMVVNEMEISRLTVYAHYTKEEKTKENERKSKRDTIDSFNFPQRRSNSGNHSQLNQKSSALSHILLVL